MIVVILIHGAAFADQYNIKLVRPEKVGDKYIFSGTATQFDEIKTSQGLNVLKQTKSFFSGQLETKVHVLPSNDNGGRTKLRLVVSKCSVIDGSLEKELLKPGTEIISQLQEGEEVFTINNKPVPLAVENILAQFFSFGNSNITDDDVFGTKEAKKVGDKWPVRSDQMAKMLAEDGVIADLDKINGNTTLEKIIEVDGVKALHITGNVEIGSPSSTSLPSTLLVEKANVSVSFSGNYPIDTSLAPISDRLDMTMTFIGRRASPPDNSQVVVSLRREQSVEKRYRSYK